MKRHLRLGQIEKTKLFSQKEAQWLSGFSRSQLLTWEELGIVKPGREYAILYSWDLVILLRILYHLRRRWTIQEIIKGFQNSKDSLDEMMPMVRKWLVIVFGEFCIDGHMYIKILANNLSNGNNIYADETKKILETDDFSSVNNRGRQTEISVPKIIQELIILAEAKEIKNLDLKCTK